MEFLKLWQPLAILLVILISCLICICKLRPIQSNKDQLLDKKDKQIILLFTLCYTLLSFFRLGEINHFKAWHGDASDKSFIIQFAKPTNVSSIYYYYGLGDGNLQLEFTNDQNLSGQIPFNNNLAIYKWMPLLLPPYFKYTQLRISVDKAPIELKQLALFDANQQLVTNYHVISANNDESEIKSILASAPPANYKNTLLSSMYFDEVYYARTAYEYLHGLSPYAWVHPPLGILLVALGIIIFGMSPFGWRFVPNLAGITLVPLIYIVSKSLFKSRKAAIISSILLMFEFMHFSLTRQASIDSSEAVLILLEYYYLYQYYQLATDFAERKSVQYVLFKCGICFGVGMAIKWEAIFTIFSILPLLVYCEIWLGRPRLLELLKTIAIYALFLIVIPLSIYALSYIPYFASSPETNFFKFIVNLQGYMLDYHTHYAENVTHPYASSWWAWPIIYRPLSVFYWQDDASNLASSVVLMGNPAIWWFGIICVMITLISAIRSRDKVPLFLCLAIISLYGPWIFVGRLSFIYYFYEVVPFWILAICYVFEANFFKKRKYLIKGYLLLVIGLFILFYPALSGLPVARSYVVQYLHWFSSWNF